jgi:hypothetical protein
VRANGRATDPQDGAPVSQVQILIDGSRRLPLTRSACPPPSEQNKSSSVLRALQVFRWAVDPHDGAPVSQVQIRTDDAPATGPMTLGQPRPDVATSYTRVEIATEGALSTVRLYPIAPDSSAPVDVHGNQVGAIEQSRCFDRNCYGTWDSKSTLTHMLGRRWPPGTARRTARLRILAEWTDHAGPSKTAARW